MIQIHGDRLVGSFHQVYLIIEMMNMVERVIIEVDLQAK